MQPDYSDYNQNYPRTLEHIDLYYGAGMTVSNLNEEDKYRIVARIIEDRGDDLDRGEHDDLNNWFAHFMRKPDKMSIEIYRRTQMQAIYKNYEKAIIGMFEAIEAERLKELKELCQSRNYFYNKERYYESRAN